ncbi:hypothetical protein BDV93DRAFT_287329 [Ceratobasidium sp. AG-I]|nr:hypothetical protein BDV93DRAFT_287329 [Ceratobasidium sp. AG-I]
MPLWSLLPSSSDPTSVILTSDESPEFSSSFLLLLFSNKNCMRVRGERLSDTCVVLLLYYTVIADICAHDV